jgi:hypothetical protein
MPKWEWWQCFAGFMGFCTGVATLAMWIDRPLPGVTESNFHRIWVGMTWQQVEDLLRADDTGLALLEPPEYQGNACVTPFPTSGFYFRQDEGCFIHVSFDKCGRLESCSCSPPPSTLLDRWRRLLIGR